MDRKQNRQAFSDTMALKALERYEPDPNSGCWLWLGKLNGHGYGVLNYQQKTHRAHRFMYERHVGPIPDGLNILHSCDTPSCVNPSHLSPGTQSENMAQMYARRRKTVVRVSGEKSPHAKMSAETAEKIRQMVKAGVKTRHIMRELPVTRGQVNGIKTGKCWAIVRTATTTDGFGSPQ